MLARVIRGWFAGFWPAARRWLRVQLESLVIGGAIVVATGAALWLWAAAGEQTKQADLATSLVGGFVVATVVVIIERRIEGRQRRAELLTLIASDQDLSGVHLPGADLRHARVFQKKLTNATLPYARLRGAAITFSNLAAVDLRGADLRQAELWQCDLTGASLRKVNARSASFESANLHIANCQGGDFTGANLVDAHLEMTDLSDASLRGAKLAGRLGAGGPCHAANFRGARLYGADLTGAVLVVEDLEYGGTIVGVDLHGAEANERTRWPTGFDPVAAGVVILPGNQRRVLEPARTDPAWQDVTGSARPGSWATTHTDPYGATNAAERASSS